MKIFKLLRALNVVASIVIAILAIYIFLHPFFPDFVYALKNDKFDGYGYQSTKSLEVLGGKAKQLPSIPKDNFLVIPRMYVNSKINEGDGISTLSLGMWHRPNTSTPDKGGNMVITAHRFLYTDGPNTFYHLDKIKMNDFVLVYWLGKEYVYKVYDITQVEANQVDIEYNTKDPIITLYSCTPLWTAEKRLVVKASLQK